jgi:hypothetical protein
MLDTCTIIRGIPFVILFYPSLLGAKGGLWQTQTAEETVEFEDDDDDEEEEEEEEGEDVMMGDVIAVEMISKPKPRSEPKTKSEAKPKPEPTLPAEEEERIYSGPESSFGSSSDENDAAGGSVDHAL